MSAEERAARKKSIFAPTVAEVQTVLTQQVNNLGGDIIDHNANIINIGNINIKIINMDDNV